MYTYKIQYIPPDLEEDFDGGEYMTGDCTRLIILEDGEEIDSVDFYDYELPHSLIEWIDSDAEAEQAGVVYFDCPGCDFQFIDTGEKGVCDNCNYQIDPDDIPFGYESWNKEE